MPLPSPAALLPAAGAAASAAVAAALEGSGALEAAPAAESDTGCGGGPEAVGMGGRFSAAMRSEA